MQRPSKPNIQAARGPPSESRLPKDTAEPGLETSEIEYGESREPRQEMTKVGPNSPAGLPSQRRAGSDQPSTGICEQSRHASAALGAGGR